MHLLTSQLPGPPAGLHSLLEGVDREESGGLRSPGGWGEGHGRGSGMERPSLERAASGGVPGVRAWG